MRTTHTMLFLTLALTGCGRLGFGEGDEASEDPEGGGNAMGGIIDASARGPSICEVANNFGVAQTDAIDLAVTSTPSGVTLVWAELAGGDLMGIDFSSARVASPIKRIQIGNFTASSAAYLDNQLVAGGISTSRAIVHTVPQPIDTGTEIGNFDGEYMGKRTLAHSNGERITATSCSSGLTLNMFDNLWNGSAGTLNVSTNQSENIDLTPIGTEAFTVWSTLTSCHYERVTSASTGTTRQTNSKACMGARLTSAGTEVAMVFEEGTRSGIVIDDFSTLSVNNAIYVDNAREPRVVFDGAHYWFSYLDTGDRVVLGYVDDSGMAITSRTGMVAPADKAYELGLLDGKPWLFSVDAGGSLSGAGICLPAS